MKRFISYPSSLAENPCIKLLNDQLECHGWKEELSINLWLAPVKSIRLRKFIQIIHFHWPESFWRTKSIYFSLIKCLVFILQIKFWQYLGYKLSFSAHNVLPHYGKINYPLERMMRRFIVRHFDVVIGHSFNALGDLKSVLGIEPGNYTLGLHGVYENFKLYVKPLATKEVDGDKLVRLHLACSEHAYKGTSNFIRLFCSLPGDVINNFTLVLTGKVSEDELKILAEKDVDYEYVTGGASRNTFLTNKELADVINGVDHVVLPYEDITTSGAYFLALTFMKGVVATKLDFFQLHSFPDTCLLYEPGDPSSLESVLRELAANWRPNTDRLVELNERFNWKDSAMQISQVWRKVVKAD